MNDKEYLEFEDRAYVSPTISRDEQLDFVDNYRKVLQNNVQRINTQTHNLGTNVPSNLGGLTGADATFETRYVTPQSNAAVAELRTKAQGAALTQALTNLKNQMEKRYKDAYRNARIKETTTPKDPGDDESKVDVEKDGGDDKTVEKNPNTGEGELVMTSDGHGTIQFGDNTYNVHDAGATGKEAEKIFLGQINPFTKRTSGEIQNVNGIKYIYINNNQYPGKWFVVE